jgi:hypothetical protein
MSRAALLSLLMMLSSAAAPAAAQDGAVLRGRVVAADAARPAGLRAYLRWQISGTGEMRADSTAVDSAGRFAMALADSLPDSVTVIVDAADPAARTHHPALARMSRAEAGREHGFVLMPREWTIVAGSYAGTRVPVSPERATRPVCAGCSGFWVRMGGPRAPAGFSGWTAARFPLAVAFDRAASVPAGAAPDSAAFWRAARGVEEALGQRLFRPVSYAQTLARFADEDHPGDVVLVRVDRALSTSGLTTTVGSRGSVEYAAVSLRTAGSVTAPEGGELVSHELMHALGMGHTCAWRSVLADVNRCPQRRAPTPTAEDVAYAQLLYRVRALQQNGAFRWGLDAAVEGERALEPGNARRAPEP